MAIYSLPNSLFELSARLPRLSVAQKPFHKRSAFSVIPDRCFGESILVYHLPQLLEHGARVEPILVSM